MGYCCGQLCLYVAGEGNLSSFPYGGLFKEVKCFCKEEPMLPFLTLSCFQRHKEVVRVINQKLLQRTTEEQDVLTSLRSRRTACESLGLDGTLRCHQAPSSFHPRTDQLNPDVHRSDTEIKTSCSMRNSFLYLLLISDGFADEMDHAFFQVWPVPDFELKILICSEVCC